MKIGITVADASTVSCAHLCEACALLRGRDGALMKRHLSCFGPIYA